MFPKRLLFRFKNVTLVVLLLLSFFLVYTLLHQQTFINLDAYAYKLKSKVVDIEYDDFKDRKREHKENIGVYINEGVGSSPLTCEKWEYDPANYTLRYFSETTSTIGNTKCSYPHNEVVKKIIKSNDDIVWKGCTQDTERCPENPYFDYKRSMRINLAPCCRQHLMDMLQTFTVVLERFGVTNFLATGGVIGWYRNREMVPYDPEFDFHIDGRIWKEETWNIILGVLTHDYGYHYEYLTDNKVKLYYSRTNNLTIDVWPYYIGDETGTNVLFKDYIMVQDDFYTPVHISLVFPLKKDKLGGVSVNIPGKTKEYLDETYGKGKWEIPYKCTKFKWGECIE